MQLSFLELVPYGDRKTLAGMRLDLWRNWSDGNWWPTIKHVNLVVGEMEKRIRNMAPVKQNNSTNGTFFWVNAPVEDNDVEKIDELFPTPDVTFGLLTGVLTEGLKVSFALNSRNDLTICSLSDRREGSPTFGACLTGGADGWYSALCVCLYKYTALLHGDLANGSRSNGEARRII